MGDLSMSKLADICAFYGVALLVSECITNPNLARQMVIESRRQLFLLARRIARR